MNSNTCIEEKSTLKRGKLSNEEKRIIEDMRTNRCGYREIAKMLNCKVDRIKDYCKRNNLAGFRGYNFKVEEAYERFIKGFTKRHGARFIYLSGFINCEEPILIQCKQCGHSFKRSASAARKDRNIACDNCNKLYSSERERKESLEKLRKEILKSSAKVERALIEIDIKKCKECGKYFYNHRGSCCSERCTKRRVNHLKELNRRKRLKSNGKIDYSISLSKVIKKEKNICYICGRVCNSLDYYIDSKGNFIVGRDYPSIEHVIPVSKGGTHTWGNIKLAHHYCNTIKGDKSLVEVSGQIALMI